MGKRKRKYYVSDHGGIRASNQKSFLVYWKDNNHDQKQNINLSEGDGPYTDFKEAEKIMIKHLINGVCSWIVSYNG